jgi:ZIP family zinc transporter
MQRHGGQRDGIKEEELTILQMTPNTPRNAYVAVKKRVQAASLYQSYSQRPPLIRTLILSGSLALAVTAVLAFLYAYVSRIIAIGFLASLLAGMATGLGALPALFLTNVSARTLNMMLGGAAGVMLAATSFALIVPGIEYGNQIWPNKGVFVVAIGMLGGAMFLELTDRWLPHEHFMTDHGVVSSSLRKVWLFVLAITLHNFPEGVAVGVSFGSGEMHNGIVLATAIGLQNIPEGLAVALPLVGFGYDRRKAALIGTLTGLVEPVGGFLGVAAVSLFYPLLPIGMAFAAGAMLFVIVDDIIPETQARGKARPATFALITGFIVMMMLDNALG